MVAALLELINSNRPMIDKMVDLTLSRTNSAGDVIVDGYPDPALDIFFPQMSYSSLKLALLKMKTYAPSVARIVAIDSEIPVERSRVSINEEVLGNLKVAKSRLLTEEDMGVLFEARSLDLLGMGDAARALENVYLQSPALLTQAIKNLMRVFAARIACTGVCLYRDPLTRLTATELDYTSQIPAGHLPAAKTGIGRWSQYATADGIGDLTSHMSAYFDTLRRFPPYVVMSRKTAMDLLMQSSTRESVARLRGAITELGTVDAAALARMPQPSLSDAANAVSNRLINTAGGSGSTEIIVSDAIYYQSDSEGNPTISSSFIPNDYYFFAAPGMIEEAVLPTASNNFAGGLVTSTEVVSVEPPKGKLTVAGRVLPLCADPRFIAARNVEDTAISASVVG